MARCRSRHLVVITVAALLGACGPTDEPATAAAPATVTATSAAPAPTAPVAPATPGAASAATPTALAMSEVVSRWNAVASQLPVDLPAPFGRVTFAWDGEHFPHPTGKGGFAEAYGAFAKVLLAFLQGDGTFDLLAANQLFTAPLRSGVAGPQGPDAGWTLRDLVVQFSAPDAIGTHDAATRSALASVGQRIAAVAPAPVEAPKAPPPAGLADAVARWNAVAAQRPVQLPAPFGQVTFQWDGERFPHPTFKGGSAEAYGAFAGVLLAFLDAPGNFDLLASNSLFGVTLRSGVAGPQGPDAGWTFAGLVRYFGSPAAFGTHDAATRSALAAFAQRIDAIAPSGPSGPGGATLQAGP